MANKKISDLSPATLPLAGTELFEVVQSGQSLQVAASDIAATYAGTLPVAKGGTGATTLTGYVKGTGTTAMTALTKVPLSDVDNIYYGAFYDTTDQTAVVNTPTPVLFNTTYLSNGVSIVSNSRITFANAGIYTVSVSLQFSNSNTTDYPIEVWQRVNGVDGPFTGSMIVAPKSADGGVAIFPLTLIGQFTAGQYIQVMWTTPNTAVTLDYTAPRTSPYAAPAIPSAIFTTNRIS